MSIPRIIRLLAVLVASAVAVAAFAAPATAASSKRCGKTGYERVFTLGPTKGNDFRISTYRKPVKDDPKSEAPRCVILWVNKKGKAKLKVNSWSKTQNRKKGQSIQHLIGPDGYVTVSGTFDRSGPGGKSKIAEMTLWF